MVKHTQTICWGEGRKAGGGFHITVISQAKTWALKILAFQMIQGHHFTLCKTQHLLFRIKKGWCYWANYSAGILQHWSATLVHYVKNLHHIPGASYVEKTYAKLKKLCGKTLVFPLYFCINIVLPGINASLRPVNYQLTTNPNWMQKTFIIHIFVNLQAI